MSELSQRLMVTGGNITGLADQLEADGLLMREPVADERRATRLRLTPSGRERFAAMAAEHEGWVVALLRSLSRDDQLALYRLLGKLKAGLSEAAIPAAASANGASATTAAAFNDHAETLSQERPR